MNFLKNLSWSLLDRGGLLVGQFIALVILSRLLSPHDFGLIAIVAIFISFATIIVDSGLMGALIKKKNIFKEDLDTLFTYNLSISILLYIIIYISAPYISLFYNEPSLSSVIRVMSLALIVNSFGYIQTVILTRNFKFKVQAIITLISQFFSILFSIFIGKLGYGVWALVYLQLSHFLINSTLLCLVNRYKPNLSFSKKSFKEQMDFGRPLVFSNLLYVLNTNLSNSVIGKYYSPVVAGNFYQSSKLQLTPTGILAAVIDKVAFASFSRITEIVSFNKKTQEFNKIIYALTIPIFVMFNEYSKQFFLLILGSKWVEASEIFYILCFSIIPIIVKTMNRNTLKSYGLTKDILKIEILIFILSLVSLIFFLSKGILVYAYSIVFLNIIISIVGMFVIYLRFNVMIYKQISIVLYPILQSFILLYLIKLLFNENTINNLIYLNILKIFFFIIFSLVFNIKIILSKFNVQS